MTDITPLFSKKAEQSFAKSGLPDHPAIRAAYLMAYNASTTSDNRARSQGDGLPADQGMTILDALVEQAVALTQVYPSASPRLLMAFLLPYFIVRWKSDEEFMNKELTDEDAQMIRAQEHVKAIDPSFEDLARELSAFFKRQDHQKPGLNLSHLSDDARYFLIFADLYEAEMGLDTAKNILKNKARLEYFDYEILENTIERCRQFYGPLPKGIVNLRKSILRDARRDMPKVKALLQQQKKDKRPLE